MWRGVWGLWWGGGVDGDVVVVERVRSGRVGLSGVSTGPVVGDFVVVEGV